MTIDDVVVRTVTLLGLVAVAGGLAWALVPLTSAWPVIAICSIGALIIGLYVSFRRSMSPTPIIAYAALQGVAVGLLSKFYETFYSGIVMQAIIGTFAVFFAMAALYKFRVIRATPRFTRGLIGALIGVTAVIVVNFILSMFGIQTGLRGTTNGHAGALAIGFSLLVIVIAALTFILDFDQVEQGVRYGVPREMAWYCAFGILIGLIWLYLEVLRLLSYLRDR
jgi:uncharacterized YccA/Bax inhibitor family protein